MTKALEAPKNLVRTSLPCLHCGLPTFCHEDETRVFCCNGCMGAYSLIHELGLEDFYSLRSARLPNGFEAGGLNESRSAILEALNAAGVEVHPMADGLCSVRLAVDGLHCAACTWLIERMQPTIPGLQSAQVRMSDQTIELIYDPKRIQPVNVAKKLAKLGYSLSPWTVDSQDEQGFLQQQREHWMGIASAAFFAANAMWIGVALYAGESTGISAGHETFLRWVGTVLALFAAILPGRIFFQTAWQAIRTRTPHVDIPIALSLLMGGGGSVIGAVRGGGHIYFDSLASLILLLRMGRYIQFQAQYRTSLSLARLLRWNTLTATRLETDGSTKIVPASRLQLGDRIEVRPGETIPADGIVTDGDSCVDTSLLNGESSPASIFTGDVAVGGTVNILAPLRIAVTAAGASSRVGRLMELVRNASTHRTRSITAADRVSKWFVIVVLLLAVLTWSAWCILASAAIATQHTMALLTIACPCALALAAPLVLTVALGRAANRQIWIRDGNCLERLATPGTLWLDKTGTLTYGRMSVIDFHGDDEAIPYAAALEQSIHHPIAKAICTFAIPEQGQWPLATALENRRGNGAKGLVEGVRVAVGNEAWLNENGVAFSDEWLELQANVLSQNHPIVWVAINGTVRGMFEMGDPLRDDAVETLRFLTAKGWKVGILSGDRQEIVDSVANLLRADGIALDLALGQQSPENKLERIRRCKAESGRPCAMVGDGVNDAAALAMADVGIAIRGGSEQALYAAPIFIGNGRLASVAELITASTRVVRGIRRCFVASLIYNAVTMTLAILGLIHPLIAAVLMPISGLTVLAMAVSTQAFTTTRSR